MATRRPRPLHAKWNTIFRTLSTVPVLSPRLAAHSVRTSCDQAAKENMQALLGQVAKQYATKVAAYERVLVEKKELNAKLSQFSLEYGRKAEAHDKSIKQTNE